MKWKQIAIAEEICRVAGADFVCQNQKMNGKTWENQQMTCVYCVHVDMHNIMLCVMTLPISMYIFLHHHRSVKIGSTTTTVHPKQPVFLPEPPQKSKKSSVPEIPNDSQLEKGQAENLPEKISVPIHGSTRIHQSRLPHHSDWQGNFGDFAPQVLTGLPGTDCSTSSQETSYAFIYNS